MVGRGRIHSMCEQTNLEMTWVGVDQTHRDVGLEPLKLELAEQTVITARDEDLHSCISDHKPSPTSQGIAPHDVK